MKLMQHEYPMIAKIEIEMTQEMEMDCLPIRPSKYWKLRYKFDYLLRKLSIYPGRY